MTDDITLLRESIRVGVQAREEGNHPFGAVLADADGKVLMTMGNAYSTDKGPGHAETNLAREAAKIYDADFLENCTLYSAFEPCSMCSGTIYWAGIGRLVFGVTEQRLAELTGDNPENLTMSLPCREVLAAGQRQVKVVGPFPELEDEILHSHKGFW
ncbi:nucleoside deaminase [Falsihalocynthiibacter sp. SS001]|uniref:nucleoside deaminase n=1 Tax=Falsihalocynthiibacter sp. SS001 TaxID=3349698 RepID=UPI0036D35ABF